MADNPTMVMKISKDLPSRVKPEAIQRSSAVENARPVITPLPASKQVKIVNRLIDYFHTK